MSEETKEEKKIRLVKFWLGFHARRNGEKLPATSYGGQYGISKNVDPSWREGWFSGAKKGSPL